MDLANKRIVAIHSFVAESDAGSPGYVWKVNGGRLLPYPVTQGSWWAKAVSLSTLGGESLAFAPGSFRLVSPNCTSVGVAGDEYIPLASFGLPAGQAHAFVDLSHRPAVPLSSRAPLVSFELQTLTGMIPQAANVALPLLLEVLLVQASSYLQVPS